MRHQHLENIWIINLAKMALLDYINGGNITLSGDPDNVVTIVSNLYNNNGSKGLT